MLGMVRTLVTAAVVFAATSETGLAQGTPAPQSGTYTVKDFRFSDGQTLPELKLGYTTIGAPTGEPVLVLHGTGGTGRGMMGANFGGVLFGPGQPLDAAKHYIILPDSIGAGTSSKPSDGLRMAFPKYGYEDMVRAQHRLVTEHLGVKKFKLIIGNSMGGMHAWLWGYMYPDAASHIIPMASTPKEVAGRNWMTRRMLIDTIKLDPAWNNGNYSKQPGSLAMAMAYFQMATNGGDQGLHQVAPTNAAADAHVNKALAAPNGADANDIIYQFAASWDYNPDPHLEKIKAKVMVINSADDERNPPSLGIMEAQLRRIPRASLLLIPASPDTRGHGTAGNAKWWQDKLAPFLASE